MSEFKRVFGSSKSMGIYPGDSLNKMQNLFLHRTDDKLWETSAKFSPQEFDYIIIDETHRGCDDLQKSSRILPSKISLGNDSNARANRRFWYIFAFQSFNCLRDQITESDGSRPIGAISLFWVTDVIVDGESLDDKSDFNKLVSNERRAYFTENQRIWMRLRSC